MPVHGSLRAVVKAIMNHTDPGYHGVDRGEVSATGQAAVYTGTRQVTSIAHTHDEEMLGGWKRLRGV